MLDNTTREHIRKSARHLLEELYAPRGHNIEELDERFVKLVETSLEARPQELKNLDEDTPPDWYKASSTIAYSVYADLFTPQAAGRHLDALCQELDYFTELGINLIHILPVLKSSGDGGFATADYTQVDPRVSTNAAFQALTRECHHRGIRVAYDFVLNHVSNNHPWAKAAVCQNHPEHNKYKDFFVWDETGTGEPWPGGPNVFPEFAPGHWDYVPEMGNYIWATFYKRYLKVPQSPPTRSLFDFAQWDVNYREPSVLLGMLEYLLNLANWGIDLFRLDAVPYLWKERGTCCANLPQVHTILKLLRLGLQSVAPRAVLLAEANGDFKQLIEYFGEGDEVQIVYHFPVMPALWQAVTLGDVSGIQSLANPPRAVDSAHRWVFSECHDELTLSHVDEALRKQLVEYFDAGGNLRFRQFKEKDVPRGVCGTTFSLLRGDMRRILLLWQLKLSIGWTPMFYMGEELGVENDLSYQQDPARCRDSRFVKRVALSRDKKDRRHQIGSSESYLYYSVKELIAWRKQHSCLVRPPDFFDTGSPSVLGFSKQDEQERMVILANCSEVQQTVSVPGLGHKTLEPLEFWSSGNSIGS
jgi:amylosucrase